MGLCWGCYITSQFSFVKDVKLLQREEEHQDPSPLNMRFVLPNDGLKLSYNRLVWARHSRLGKDAVAGSVVDSFLGRLVSTSGVS